MRALDSILLLEQLNDSLLLSNFPQLNLVADDTIGFAAVTECSPEPLVVYVNEEPNWLKDNFSVLVALVSFILGWVLTRFFMCHDEKRKRGEYRNAVLNWIDLMEPTESKLIKSVKKLSKSISKSDDIKPVAFQMPNTIPDKIKDLSVESMMDAFGRGDDKEKRNRYLYNIISQFDYLTKMNEEIRKEYNRYNNLAVSLCKDWNNVFMPYSSEVERARNPEVTTAFIQWMAELEQKQKQEQKQKPDSIVIHQKYLDIIDDILNEPNFAIKEMKRIVNQIQANNKGFAKLFDEMAKRMQDSVDVLKKSADFFREHPEKKRCFCS